MYQLTTETPLGWLFINGDAQGITRLHIQSHPPVVPDTEAPDHLHQAVVQFQEYFGKSRKEFDLKLHLMGTEFQKKVWTELSQIPFGKTISYQQLALRLGHVKWTRAVALANAKNPLWVVIPCHRVIGSNGTLTGYAGGLWRKKWLLDWENNYQQTALF